MQRFAFGALAGVLLFQYSPVLPGAAWLVPGGFLLWLLARRRRVLAAGGLAGLLWALAHALATAPPSLPPELAGRDLTVTGVIAAPVDRRGNRARFRFAVEAATAPAVVGMRLRLSWYQPPDGLRADQRWRLTVRLKPRRGYANPGGFDYEGWLYRQGVAATGYVRPATPAQLAESAGRFRLARLRGALAQRLADALQGRPAAGVIRALVVGDRSGIDDDLWEVFRRTGTSHLVAISGLHIGLVAGLVAWPILRLWRRAPRLVRRWPAQHAAALAGLLAALPYAALAGFTLPTQRALMMLAVGVAVLLARRAVVPSQVLALALLGALLRSPAAVVEPGLWLSFGAVAVILLTLSDTTAGRGWRSWLRVQAALTFGLAPALVAFAFPVPLAGLLANAAAVPWYGFLVVPAALLGGLAEAAGLGDGLLRLAEWLAALSLPVLQFLAGASLAALPLPAAPGPATLALALLGVTVLLLPRGLPGRRLGAVLLLPLLFGTDRQGGLAPGDFRATVLDVGQGLAVVVETRHRVLVYDTGPAYRGGFDTGAQVVAPFLAQRRRARLDRLILSHADNDHMGGAKGLLRAVTVGEVNAGEPVRLPGTRAAGCPDGAVWSWDGVDFRLAHPGAGWAREGNDASCVLRVANAAGSLLLTGDIELPAEQALLASQPDMLPADVVVAAHHGSRTSSGTPFVAAAGARYVVYSAGYRNRWGFPAPEVAARWRAAGAHALNTANSGAIQFDFDSETGLAEPQQYRKTHRRYWHVATGPRKP